MEFFSVWNAWFIKFACFIICLVTIEDKWEKETESKNESARKKEEEKGRILFEVLFIGQLFSGCWVVSDIWSVQFNDLCVCVDCFDQMYDEWW